MDKKYDPENLLLQGQRCIESKKEKSKSQPEETIAERVKLRRQKADISSLERDEEEVKDGKGLKMLTPNKLLARLPILLAQIKVGDNLYKLKN